MIREAINELKKYTSGKKNTEKIEISVLALNRIIFALEELDPVLDSIRAEIEGVIQEETIVDQSGGEYESVISKLDPDDVLQIIDKYKAGQCDGYAESVCCNQKRQIVISIPNWLYNAIMEYKEPHYSQSLGEAVRDGMPLPKGHGDLIDVDDIRVIELEDSLHIIRHEKGDGVDVYIEAPTIIEADRTNNEAKDKGLVLEEPEEDIEM